MLPTCLQAFTTSDIVISAFMPRMMAIWQGFTWQSHTHQV